MNWSRIGPDAAEAQGATPTAAVIIRSIDPATTREADDGRLAPLRGAAVGPADLRRVGRVLVIVLLVALATSAVVLGVAGAERNDRIAALEHNGVPVTITVSGCTGLIGGSGSNDAGYACRAAYSVGARHYREGIPGDVDYAPGTRLAAVVDRTDPALVSPTDVLDFERPSRRVFVLPAALLSAWTILTCAVVYAARRNRRQRPGN